MLDIGCRIFRYDCKLDNSLSPIPHSLTLGLIDTKMRVLIVVSYFLLKIVCILAETYCLLYRPNCECHIFKGLRLLEKCFARPLFETPSKYLNLIVTICAV